MKMENIKQIFKLNDVDFKETSTGEIYFKCPYCSNKHSDNKFKMYLGYNEERKSYAYICFRCGAKGYNLYGLFKKLKIPKRYYKDFNFDIKSLENKDIQDRNKIFYKLYNLSLKSSFIHLRKKLENKSSDNYNIGKLYLTKRVSSNISKLKNLVINTNQSKIYINNKYVSFGYYIILPSFKYTKIICRLYKGDNIKHRILKLYSEDDSVTKNDPFILINDYNNPELFIVEGMFDMLKLYNFGKNVISLSGKSKLKSVINQILFMKKYYLKNINQIVYFLDNDITNKDLDEIIQLFSDESLDEFKKYFMVSMDLNIKDAGDLKNINDFNLLYNNKKEINITNINKFKFERASIKIEKGY